MLLSSGGNCEVALQLVHLCVQFHYQPSYSFVKKETKEKKTRTMGNIYGNKGRENTIACSSLFVPRFLTSRIIHNHNFGLFRSRIQILARGNKIKQNKETTQTQSPLGRTQRLLCRDVIGVCEVITPRQ